MCVILQIDQVKGDKKTEAVYNR